MRGKLIYIDCGVLKRERNGVLNGAVESKAFVGVGEERFRGKTWEI